MRILVDSLINFEWNDRTHTMASVMRDIQNGTQTIMHESTKADESTLIGLYLPHGMTFWFLFTKSHSGENMPEWNPAYYKITRLDERFNNPRDRQALWNHGWESCGNRYALCSKYTETYSTMINQDDGYWK